MIHPVGQVESSSGRRFAASLCTNISPHARAAHAGAERGRRPDRRLALRRSTRLGRRDHF